MPRSLPRIFGLLGLLALLVAALATSRACKGDHARVWAAPASVDAPDAAHAALVAPDAPISDARLARAITGAIALDPVLRAQRIRVSVVRGAVTLAGTVRTVSAAWRATRLVAHFKGATLLADGMVVDTAARPDPEIANDVTDAFKSDPATRTADVQPTASGATLTLRGTADSYSQRDLLGEIAAHVRGVRHVHLEVVVPRATVRADTEIAAAVTDRLREDAWLAGTRVVAGVNGGAAALSGVVGSLAQRDAAVGDALDAGAASVDAQGLRVDWRECEQARARAEAVRPPPIDQEIADAVRRWLASDAIVGQQAPIVRVDQGVVTLSGNVEDFHAAGAARRDARRVSGVWRVEDGMTVAAVKRQSDATIRKQVLRAIYEDVTGPDSRDLYVLTANARVTLRGTVASEENRKVIEADAEEVPGVVAVENDLRVEGYGPQTEVSSPQSLRHRVIEALFWDPRVVDGKVTVEVAPNGDVTLDGLVDTWDQARAAGDDAVRAGAAHVINWVRAGGPP